MDNKTVAETMSLRQQQLNALRVSICALHNELQSIRVYLNLKSGYKDIYKHTDKAISEFLKLTDGVFHL
jgi:hypothetical protein